MYFGNFTLGIHFIVSNRGECQLPRTFFRNGKIFFLAKVIALSNLKNTTITLRVRTLITISQKSTLKSISSYKF